MQYGIYYTIIYTIVIALMAAQLSEHKKQSDGKKINTSGKNNNIAIIVSMILALAIRIPFAMMFRGLTNDMNCFEAWSDQLFTNQPWNFYWAEGLHDYPPGYMAILWFVGAVKRIFNFVPPATWLAVKFPAMVCDVLLGGLIYKIAKEKYNSKFALNIFYIFVFNPLIVVDSVFWGQIDSVLTLFLVLSFCKVKEEKYVPGALLYVAAALIKPQALLLFPIYVFIYLRTKDWKIILKSVGYGLALVWAVSVPFARSWTEVTGIAGAPLAFLKTFNILWVFQNYLSTMTFYSYASVNAYNFFALIGANWKPLNDRFLFATYQFWGNVVIIFSVLASFWCIWKKKIKEHEIFGVSFIFLFILFTFATSMHERYLYPAIIFLLILYLLYGDKRLLTGFIILSFTNFLNVLHVLIVYAGNADSLFVGLNPGIIFISAVNVIAFIFIIRLAYNLFIKGEAVLAVETKKTFKTSSRSAQKKVSSVSRLEGWFLPSNDIWEEIKLVRLDYIILAVIILVYSVLALWNLGDRFAPESFYKPVIVGEQFTAEFEKPERINKLSFYPGIGKVEFNPGMKIEYSLDGENWTELRRTIDPDPVIQDKMVALKEVFKWQDNKFETVEAKYIRGTPEAVNIYDLEPPIIVQYTVGEIAFWNENGSMVTIASVTGTEGSNYEAVFDEQWTVPAKSTFMNGTYFDEIYHPRTAYENVNFLPYYETTHPPLGKLLIALGVKIFGMNPFGWRIMGTLFGIFMIPVFYIFLKKMFKETRYAFIGTLLFTFDFMHYSLTRIGTIDTYPVFFIITSYYFMYQFGRRALYYSREDSDNFFSKKYIWKMLIPLMFSGIIWGLACASKWIGIYAGGGLLILFLLIMSAVYKRFKESGEIKNFERFTLTVIGWCLLFFVAVPVAIYILSYIPICMVPGYEGILNTVWENQKYMYDYHSRITDWHPFSSAWWQWPIMVRPLWAYQAPASSITAGNAGSITIMGNPLVWWPGILAFFYGIYYGIRRKSKTAGFAAISLLSQYMPWWTISRVIFIYHFFASVPFMIMLMLYSIRELEQKYDWFKYATAVYCALVLVAFAMFFPILSGLEFPKWYGVNFLKWFETWTLFS